MAEGNKPFVVTDRRKFTMDGEVRPDAERESKREEDRPAETAAQGVGPRAVAPEVREDALPDVGAAPSDGGYDARADADPDAGQDMPPAPTQEQTDRSRAAYEQTTDRLDTAIRATNPGGEHPRPMDFMQMVQSFYMTAIVQLGGMTQEGQQPQVDLLGARQSIDMLGVLQDRTKGNLSPDEGRLLESALFDARMVFLEVTQAIARQAQQAAGKGGVSGAGGLGGPGGGMGIVR